MYLFRLMCIVFDVYGCYTYGNFFIQRYVHCIRSLLGLTSDTPMHLFFCQLHAPKRDNHRKLTQRVGTRSLCTVTDPYRASPTQAV